MPGLPCRSGDCTGLSSLCDINIISLRQAIVPNALLGRVVSTTRTIGQSCAPLGALLGSLLIARTGVAFTYATAGALALASCLLFAFSPLGRGEEAPLQPPHQANPAIPTS
jgi:hypothetical protein